MDNRDQTTDPHAQMGARELKKIRNRQAILAAGQRVFAQIGYDAATVRDIVRESGLSPGTFYNYFQDKETVFQELMNGIVGDLRGRVQRARGEARDAHGFLANAFLAFFNMFRDQPELLQLVSRNQAVLRGLVADGQLVSALFSELAADLERAMDSGMMPRAPVQWMTWVMAGAGFEILAQMAKDPEIEPLAMANFLSDLFQGGMARVAGRASVETSSAGK